MSGFIFKLKHLEGLSTVPPGSKSGTRRLRLLEAVSWGHCGHGAAVTAPGRLGCLLRILATAPRSSCAPAIASDLGRARAGVTAGSLTRGTWLRVSSRVCEPRRLHPERSGQSAVISNFCSSQGELRSLLMSGTAEPGEKLLLTDSHTERPGPGPSALFSISRSLPSLRPLGGARSSPAWRCVPAPLPPGPGSVGAQSLQAPFLLFLLLLLGAANSALNRSSVQTPPAPPPRPPRSPAGGRAHAPRAPGPARAPPTRPWPRAPPAPPPRPRRSLRDRESRVGAAAVRGDWREREPPRAGAHTAG